MWHTELLPDFGAWRAYALKPLVSKCFKYFDHTGTVVGLTSAWGHDLRPGDLSYRFQEYEAIVNRSAQVKQVYQWPNIANAIVFAMASTVLVSCDTPPDEIQVLAQAA